MTIKPVAKAPRVAAPIRLLLVDDHVVMRAGLANVLAMDSHLQVVAQVDGGEEALELWRKLKFDVMLLDINLMGVDGLDILRRLRIEFPDARVLILTSSEAEEDARQALRSGAAGYVTKCIRAAELVEAIRTVHGGGEYVSDKVQRKLAEDAASGRLSQRELEVLGLVRQGFTNDEIGRFLGISERTARAHVGAILEKFHASDRAAAVARGFECGILKA